MTDYQIKRVCMYCKTVMGFKDGGTEPDLVSHGICEKCEEKMKTKAKHSPLRFHVGTSLWEPGVFVKEKGDFIICKTYGMGGEANARFIVLACNSHYDLLEAARQAPIKRLDKTHEEFLEVYKKWYRTIRKEAIAKAES